jgi:formylglycine-generating enzyme required for sulfatase activity
MAGMSAEQPMAGPAQPAPEPRTPNPEPAVKPRPDRSLTGFYVAVGVVIALGLFGGWFWKTWTVWWFDADEARRRQGETAQRLGLPVEKAVDLGDGVKLELVLIPAGRFRMGNPADEKDQWSGEAQHWVVITRPFYMGKYEVTQAQWTKMMWAKLSNFKGAKNPVECVSWDDSQDFLKKLNALGKERGQFRLPTEAEWEWACRAGTRTRFCSGDADEGLADYAWFGANSGSATHPVGEKRPNAWGLHDLHGNVWEWCGDWYGADYYAKGPRYDPTGPATGSDRVLRGGSWGSDTRYCRSSYRYGNYPANGSDNVGFRVVFVPAGP